MSQTNQTVNELINKAFYLTGEFGPDEEIPTNYTNEALDLLNDLINHFSTNAYNIPLINILSWKTVSGQSTYKVGNSAEHDIISNRITSIEYLNYKFSETDSILYPMKQITRTQLFENSILDEVGSVPTYYLIEKEITQTRIILYPAPSQVYFMTMRAKFYIDKFEMNQVITNVPLSEQRFLKFALAKELTFIYPSSNWTAEKEQEYQKMNNDRFSANDIDMTATRSGLLENRGNYYSGLGSSILAG